MRGGFDPFAALGMLSALAMAGLVALRLTPPLQQYSGRLALALAAAYLLGGAAIFAAAWLM